MRLYVLPFLTRPIFDVFAAAVAYFLRFLCLCCFLLLRIIGLCFCFGLCPDRVHLGHGQSLSVRIFACLGSRLAQSR